jgi:calcium-dependent protein kinase
MYLLLCGRPPFHGRDDREVLAKVRKGNLAFIDREWRHISMDARDLVEQLMRRNPRERITAEAALNHDWIKHKAPRATGVALKQGFVDKLSNFRSHCRLKKAALQIIARELNDAQLGQLRAAFVKLDTNGDGLLSLAELREGLTAAGLSSAGTEDLQEIMDGIDTDGSGVIEYSEFLAATLDRRRYLQEDVLKIAFDTFDIDRDGHITKEELRKVLNEDVDAEQPGTQPRLLTDTSRILNMVDEDGDGKITFIEFTNMMSGDYGDNQANRTRTMFEPEPQTWWASLFTPRSGRPRSSNTKASGAAAGGA